jgi:hypothetical protein
MKRKVSQMRAISKTVSAATCAVLAVGVALPADANVRRFTDSHRDSDSGVDIWSVRVDNSTAVPSEIRIRIKQDNVRSGDSVTIYIDTRPTNPGPEFAFSGTAGSEYALHHTKGWRETRGLVPFRCGYRMRINEVTDVTRAVLPRRCLGEPGAVRVAVHAVGGMDDGRDWAKARRTFFGFVLR